MNGKHVCLWGLILIAWLGVACSPGSSGQGEADRIATGVAEARAIAATLTASAPTVAPTEVVAQVTPTNTSEASSPATDTPAPPTDTVVPPTAEPTQKPTVAASQPPTPTNTAEPQRADPFVPGGGEPKGLVGRIFLPGYGGGPKVKKPVFDSEIAFRLFVYDPDKGNTDGAGIISVDMSVTNPNGDTVHNRTERKAAYCAFGGGEPFCNIWSFPEHHNHWPDGTPVCKGQGYQAQMVVHTQDDNKDGALWQFNFDIDGNYPPC